MIEFISAQVEEEWDRRHWQLALTREKPIEAYIEIRKEYRSIQDTPSVDELSPEQQSWLRSG